MSRAEQFEKQAGKVHPATIKLTWDNTNSTFKVYNKTTKANTLASLPMRFMVIDNYNCITGWCEKTGTSYYSNEIKNVNTEKLTVKAGDTTMCSGLYSELKEGLAANGAKYSESVYVLFEDGTVGNIILAGSNCAAWFNFKAEAKANIVKQWVGMGNPQKQKKGSITWSVPEIKLLEAISDEEANRADNAYEAIQEYKAGITTSEITMGGKAPISLDEILKSRASENSDEIEDDGLDLGY